MNGNAYVGPEGWICPKCGRVYSPLTPMCFYCTNKVPSNDRTNFDQTEWLSEWLKEQKKGDN